MTDTLLAMHQQSSEARIKMGKFSKTIVANYGPQHFAEGLFKAIETALMLKSQ
jgi:hypothetical protein